MLDRLGLRVQTMKLALVVAMVAGMVGCCWAQSKQSPPSNLDGKPNYPNSWHSAHVTAYTIYSNRFRLDDRTLIKCYFTGGTDPEIPQGSHGILYVSVPSWDEDDADNTYYFQKFVPDRKP